MVDPVSDPAPDSGPDAVSDSGSDSGIAPVSAPVHFDPATLVYNSQGLIPAIAQEEGSNAVLMMAWMNAASLARTLASGRVTYWSRSRRAFWTKGETSGHGQELVELRIDCDRDCLLLIVRQRGPACHTRRKSCFYTGVRAGAEVELMAPLGPDAAETGPPQRS